MLQAAAHHSVEDGVAAMGHRVDLHHVPFRALAVILRKLSERPFELAYARQETALDHDLRLRRCKAPAISSSSTSIGAMACEASKVSGSTPTTSAASSGRPPASAIS